MKTIEDLAQKIKLDTEGKSTDDFIEYWIDLFIKQKNDRGFDSDEMLKFLGLNRFQNGGLKFSMVQNAIKNYHH